MRTSTGGGAVAAGAGGGGLVRRRLRLGRRWSDRSWRRLRRHGSGPRRFGRFRRRGRGRRWRGGRSGRRRRQLLRRPRLARRWRGAGCLPLRGGARGRVALAHEIGQSRGDLGDARRRAIHAARDLQAAGGGQDVAVGQVLSRLGDRLVEARRSRPGPRRECALPRHARRRPRGRRSRRRAPRGSPVRRDWIAPVTTGPRRRRSVGAARVPGPPAEPRWHATIRRPRPRGRRRSARRPSTRRVREGAGGAAAAPDEGRLPRLVSPGRSLLAARPLDPTSTERECPTRCPGATASGRHAGRPPTDTAARDPSRGSC